LPTEAEFEYATRAGTATPIYQGEVEDWWICGNPPLDAFCWYVCNHPGQPAEVGQKDPNAWGLYDMAGNVAEWVWDWYGTYTDDEQTDPLGPDSGTERTIRSSFIAGYGPSCRSAFRASQLPDWKSNGTGLRLARGYTE